MLVAVLALSLAGIGLATFLVANHYQYVGAEFCSIGPLLSCENVNTGPYSTIPEGGGGIPWSVIGLASFVVMFALAYLRLYYPHKDTKGLFLPLMVAVSWIGIIFVVYLNYLEVFKIHQICLLCAVSHIIMTVISWLATCWYFYGQHGAKTEAGVETSQTPDD